jgi:hypothetical protein
MLKNIMEISNNQKRPCCVTDCCMSGCDDCPFDYKKNVDPSIPAELMIDHDFDEETD